MMMKPFSFIFFFLLLINTSVFAKCNFSFDDTLSASYSLNSQTQQLISFSVNANKSDCPHFIAVTANGGTYQRRLLHQQGLAQYLPFQLYQAQQRTILKDFPDGNSSNFLIPRSLSKRMDHQFRAILSLPFTFAPAGRYSERFHFRLYDGAPGSAGPSAAASKFVEFYYILPEKIAVSLVPSGAPFDFYNKSLTLDFGNLTVGARRSFDIMVLSNAGMELTISSLNDGEMRAVGSSGVVDYRVAFDDGSFRSLKGSLASPLVIKRESGVLPLRGRRVRAQVEISSLQQASAGIYSDNIVITAATVY